MAIHGDLLGMDYMRKVLVDLGGELRRPSALPTYVKKPWREWPWWKRYLGRYINNESWWSDTDAVARK